MGDASTLVARGPLVGGFFLHQSVRRHLRAGVTVASAGPLASSLVAARPYVNSVSPAVGGVRPAAWALSRWASPSAIAAQVTRNQARTAVPVTQVPVGGAPDITTAT